MCLSDASVCTVHEHHEEAQAALMRVASMCDWTKQTDHDHSVECDCIASLHVHGAGSVVHIWTQQTLQSKHDETQLCGPCRTSPDTEEHTRTADRMARQLYQQISQLRALASLPCSNVRWVHWTTSCQRVSHKLEIEMNTLVHARHFAQSCG